MAAPIGALNIKIFQLILTLQMAAPTVVLNIIII